MADEKAIWELKLDALQEEYKSKDDGKEFDQQDWIRLRWAIEDAIDEAGSVGYQNGVWDAEEGDYRLGL